MAAGLTYTDIARTVGIADYAVRRKAGALGKYFVGNSFLGSGRPVKLYSAECLSLWGVKTSVEAAKPTQSEKMRKSRNDKGGTHSGRDLALADSVVELVFADFMRGAIPDVRGCVRRTLVDLAQNEADDERRFQIQSFAVGEWLYQKRIMRRSERFTGDYWTRGGIGWVRLHEQKYGVHRAALASATARYDIWRILENAGYAGEGFGARRFLALDDRQTDVRIDDGTESGKMQYAVYVWDVLTRELMWAEFTENVSSETYVRAILECAHRYGWHEQTTLFMENAAAAIAHKTIDAVQALYETEIWNAGQPKPLVKLFHTEGFIVRNVPQIPKGFGKAIAERSFKCIKEEFDSRIAPEAFQGGNRTETVSLTRSSTPIFRNKPTVEIYKTELTKWSRNEYLTRERDSLRAWAKAKCLPATLAAKMQYYYQPLPEANKDGAAMLLFSATRKVSIAKLAVPGALRITIDNEQKNIRSDALYAGELKDRRIAAIQIPNRPKGEFALFLMHREYVKKGNYERPEFIGIGVDFTATTIEEASVYRIESRKMRESATRTGAELNQEFAALLED